MRWHASPRDGPGKPLGWRTGKARPGLPRRASRALQAFKQYSASVGWGVLGVTVTVQCHLLLSKGRLCAGASARTSCPALFFVLLFCFLPRGSFLISLPHPGDWRCAFSSFSLTTLCEKPYEPTGAFYFLYHLLFAINNCFAVRY